MLPRSNRKVQPLVAPLIVPLDGLLNASAHGGNTGSSAGHGPWAVNFTNVLAGPDAGQVVAARGNPLAMRNGTAQRAYDPYTVSTVQNYAPVAWTPGAPSTITYSRRCWPTGPGCAVVRRLPVPGNTPVPNHPALFNPVEWPDSAIFGGRTFPLSDIKRLNRFGFAPDWYLQADITTFASTSLGAAERRAPSSSSYGVGPTTYHNYRCDPSHANRGLVTTRSSSLDRPKLAPNFLNRNVALQLQAGGFNPGLVNPQPYSPLGARGSVSDFAASTSGGAQRVANALAALGSVNINRPLADYRTDMTKTLAQDTVTNMVQRRRRPAAVGRSDIFSRLVATLGGGLHRPDHRPGGWTLPDPIYVHRDPAQRYAGRLHEGGLRRASRYLGATRGREHRRLHFDTDDISTMFVWCTRSRATRSP